MELKTSQEWNEEFPKLIILDPDGWDRSNFEESWNEKISKEEFMQRVCISTIEYRGNVLELFS